MSFQLSPFKWPLDQRQWEEVYRKLTDAIALAWTQVDTTGSALTDIADRPHEDLTDIEGWSTGTDIVQDKHISQANGKVWQDHTEITNANPHGTDHSQLDAIGELDPTSSDATKDKHLSNAQGKVWQDHVGITAANPHGTDLDQLDDVDTTASKTTPVDADAVLLQDSEASSVWKKLTWANLKTAALSAIYSMFAELNDHTGFVDNDNITVTYDSTARTITLTHPSGTIVYYWEGVRKTLTSPWTSSAHSATLDQRYFLSSSDGTNFTWSTSVWSFHYCMVALAIYYTGHKLALREVHATMDHEAHEEFHDKTGTYKTSGGTLSGYTLGSTTAADRRPDVAETVLKDEDLRTTNATLTSETYTQATLTSTGIMGFTTAAAEIVPVSGNRPYYNSYSAPNWGQTLMTNNLYMSIWLVGVPVTSEAGSQAYRYLWVQGQSEGTLASQQALSPSSLNLGDYSGVFVEFVFLAQVIIQYTAANWKITEVVTISGSRAQYTGASGSFLSTVSTDTTLTGNGTAASPLSVVDLSELYTLVDTSGGNATETLTTTLNVTGYIKSTSDANTVTFTTSDGSTIAESTYSLILQYDSVVFVKKSNVWYISSAMRHDYMLTA